MWLPRSLADSLASTASVLWAAPPHTLPQSAQREVLCLTHELLSAEVRRPGDIVHHPERLDAALANALDALS